jgi:hypothetical protein
LAFTDLPFGTAILNSRNLIGKENYIHDLFDAHGTICYARSLTSCGSQYFDVFPSLCLINVNPRLIASDENCERFIVVFTELFQQLLEDYYTSSFVRK